MNINYNRVILIEKGKRKLSEIEKICFRLQDFFNECNKKNRLFFNYKSNGKFEQEGFKKSFKLRVKIPAELAQELNSSYNLDPEEELSAILKEQIESEIINAVLREMINNQTNFKSLLLEKKVPYNKCFSAKIGIKKIFDRIAMLYAPFGYSLIVSAELLTFLDGINNFLITDERPEDTNYSMGFKKVGYYLKEFNYFKSKSNRMTVYMNPYFSPDKCLIVKNLRSPEFFVTLNTEGMVYDPSMFAPIFNNHEAHFNIPNNVSYRAFRINGAQAFI